MSLRPVCRLALLVLLWLRVADGTAQSFDFRTPATPEDADAAAQMKDLAARIIPVYQDENRSRYLANLSELQLAAGDSSAAYAARLSLRELTRSGALAWRAQLIDSHARALALTQQGTPFAAAVQRAASDVFAPLDDLAAYALALWLHEIPGTARKALADWLDQHRQATSLTLSDALDGVQRWVLFSALQRMAPVLPGVIGADEQRRYVIESPQVGTRGNGGQVLSVRPRAPTNAPPVLIELSRPAAAREAGLYFAAHGLAAVLVPSTRATDGRRDPWQQVQDRLLQVTQWTARQDWHDGRIALIGSGLGAYAAWSVAAHPLPQLAALALAAPELPGVSTPAPGGIFVNAAYERLVGLVPEASRRIDAAWYARGAPYRHLDQLARHPSPLFQRWLEHPTRDAYWRRYEPDREALLRLAAPVLILSSPFEPAQAAALRMRAEHLGAAPAADHTLLLMQAGAQLPEDPDAPGGARGAEVRELLLRWLEAVLRGTGRSAPLTAGVHAQIEAGWRDVPDVRAQALRLYLSVGPQGACRLLSHPPRGRAPLRQRMNLADRAPGAATSQPPLRGSTLPSVNGLLCSSDPLSQAVSFAGEPVLELLVRSSRLDFDLQAALYARTPEQEYEALFDPPARQRLSLAEDPERRTLFAPGEVVRLALPLQRVVAHTLRAGSRLVLVLSLLKRPDLQINYGTGTEVSDETLRDAGPLQVEYLPGTRLELPRAP